jgi:hypothetical protein
VRFDEFADKWGPRYPAIINLWRQAWQEFIPFLDYDVEIRKIICSTDESVNAATQTRSRRGRGSTVRRARPSLPDAAARSRGQGGTPGWTNDLDRGEDRGSVQGRWAWSTAKRRAGRWDCNPCHAAQPVGVTVVSRCWRPRPLPIGAAARVGVLLAGAVGRQLATMVR